MLILNSLLDGIVLRHSIPPTIIACGAQVTVAPTWATVARTAIIWFVVSQAFNRAVVGHLHQRIAKQPRRIIGAVQPELNHFAVQMVSQSQ